MENTVAVSTAYQFTWGSLLTNTGALTGYRIVASSTGVEPESVNDIRRLTGIGEPSGLVRFPFAFGVVRRKNQLVFTRYQPHLDSERGREVFQSHHLVLDLDQYAKIDCKFWYIIPHLRPISVLSKPELLEDKAISIALDRKNEISVISKYIRPTPQFLREFLDALFTPLPILIFTNRENSLLSLEAIEAVSLLLPPSVRSLLTFTTASFDARETHTKICNIVHQSISRPADYVRVNLETRQIELSRNVKFPHSTYAKHLFDWIRLDPKHDLEYLLNVVDRVHIETSTLEQSDANLADAFWKIAGAQILIWEIGLGQGQFEAACKYLRQQSIALKPEVISYLLKFAFDQGLDSRRDALDFVPDLLVRSDAEPILTDLGKFLDEKIRGGKSKEVINLLETWGENPIFLGSSSCLQWATNLLSIALALMDPGRVFEGLRLIKKWLERGLVHEPSRQVVGLLSAYIKSPDYPITKTWSFLLDLMVDRDTIRAFLNDSVVSSWFAQAEAAQALLGAVALGDRIRTKMIVDAFASLDLPLVPVLLSLVKLGLRVGETGLLDHWVSRQMLQRKGDIPPESSDPELVHLARQALSPEHMPALPRTVRPMLAFVGVTFGDDNIYQQLISDSLVVGDDILLEDLITEIEDARQRSSISTDLYSKLFSSPAYRALPQNTRRKLALALARLCNLQKDHPLLPILAELLDAASLQSKWSRDDLDFIAAITGAVRYEPAFMRANKLILIQAMSVSNIEETLTCFENVRGEFWAYYNRDHAEEQYARLLQDVLKRWQPTDLIYLDQLISALRSSDFSIEIDLIQDRLVSLAKGTPETLTRYLALSINELRSIALCLSRIDRDLITDLAANGRDAEAIALLQKLTEKNLLGSSKLDQLNQDVNKGKGNE